MKSSVLEIELLKKVDHPNIVKIYEIFKDEKALYIVMEYIEGIELFQYIIERVKITEQNSSITINLFHYKLTIWKYSSIFLNKILIRIKAFVSMKILNLERNSRMLNKYLNFDTSLKFSLIFIRNFKLDLEN